VKIVADANIPLLADAFSPLGEVVALPAARITPDAVAGADALLVRSVTRVDEVLLAASRVRFVATATIGVDHVDEAYLARRGIGFASAQGSNARSVAEYVLAALSVLAERRGERMTDYHLGIVGVGNVGGRLARMAEGLGMEVLLNDPPLARRTRDPRLLPIEALAQADVLTFHVPLAREGPDATYHMIDEPLLGRLRPGAILVNTSRGAVARTEALRAAVRAGRLGALVLDVWEGEPNIDGELLTMAGIATPHIAGYSYDGKVNGTRMVLDALCRHFGVERPWDPSPRMPPPANPRVALPGGIDVNAAIRKAIAAAYDIQADDARLRAMLDGPPDRRGPHFTALRRDYPVRREFPETAVTLDAPNPAVRAALEALDFPVSEGPAA
jgi:erythronate-4-phosphate dehydrogenase